MHAPNASINILPDAAALRYRGNMAHQVGSFSMDESSVIGDREFHQEDGRAPGPKRPPSIHPRRQEKAKARMPESPGRVACNQNNNDKNNSASALAFEMNLERNLIELHHDLVNGTCRPGRSICFVVTRPKARELWAAEFRDRVVHPLLYNHIGGAIERTFIADSCACITERGTLYAGLRLESKIRSQTQNWSVPGHYLKCDLSNFFVAIDKRVLGRQLAERIADPCWKALALQILDPLARPA